MDARIPRIQRALHVLGVQAHGDVLWAVRNRWAFAVLGQLDAGLPGDGGAQLGRNLGLPAAALLHAPKGVARTLAGLYGLHRGREGDVAVDAQGLAGGLTTVLTTYESAPQRLRAEVEVQ